MMCFVSTRGGAPAVSLSDAIRAGIAPDGGLYVPQAIPTATISATSFADAAESILRPYFEGDALESQLRTIIDDAFDFPIRVARLLPTLDADVLELFHGPTAAFKDFGARFFARCLAAMRAANDPTLTILVATSGDTGAAVAAAFHRVPGFRVVILYPDGRVSPRQAHQLGCFGDNVVALRVRGTFDDCQRLVKAAFADASLRASVPMTSANSIGLGRLLPQMSYYAWAAAQSAARRNFIVPTGNLGNAFAAMLAKASGAAIGEIALACNANETVPDWLATGEYAARPARATVANAMDVGDPSNAERVAWLYPDAEERAAMLSATSVDDATIRARIAQTFADDGYVLDPHTACAAETLARKRAAGDRRRYTLVATAHPAKFESIVEPIVGGVAVPAGLAALLERPSSARAIEPANAALAAVLRER